MSENKLLAVMALKLIAAKATKLAHDLEHGRLWDGDLDKGISDIEQQLADARRGTKP